MKPTRRFRLLAALFLLALCSAAFAQDDSAAGDPPSRVARLQFIEGQVSMQPGGVDDWTAASLNRPMTTADRLWTDRDSRAELTMASAALRMGGETSLTLTNLDDRTLQVELDQGTLSLSVRFLSPGEIVEVDTPNFAYTITHPGDFRFDVAPEDDQSWISVFRGDGEATGQANSVRVHGGQRMRFSSGQSLSYVFEGGPSHDGFDDWCAVRERRESSSQSARYVAAGTVGFEDLDDSGYWDNSPEYGTVWYPRVHEGWAPYREGHWAWINPWGWTWVDDAPWGFAPFHYGRWVCVRDRWGWIPGPVAVRPVYAPALVAWVGGSNWGVSVGIGGGVGWFPLGWHDPYIPAYHVSPVYARNVNISNSRVVNVTVINNYYSTTNINVRNTTVNNIHYENAVVRGAVTGVPAGALASGRPLRGTAVVVPVGEVGRATVMTSAAVVPTHQAVLGGHAPVVVPQHMVAPRAVVNRVAPPARPVSFEAQRPLLEQSRGVPLAPAARNNLRQSQPVIERPNPASNARPSQQPVGNATPQPGRTAPTPYTPSHGVGGDGRPQPVGNAVAPAERPTPSTPPTAVPSRTVPRPPQSGGYSPTTSRPQQELAPERGQQPQRAVQPQREQPQQREVQPERVQQPQRDFSRQESSPRPESAPAQRQAPAASSEQHHGAAPAAKPARKEEEKK